MGCELIGNFRASFGDDDLECLRERIERYIGEGLRVSFDLVESIAREASGKYRFTISHVSPRLAFR